MATRDAWAPRERGLLSAQATYAHPRPQRRSGEIADVHDAQAPTGSKSELLLKEMSQARRGEPMQLPSTRAHRGEPIQLSSTRHHRGEPVQLIPSHRGDPIEAMATTESQQGSFATERSSPVGGTHSSPSSSARASREPSNVTERPAKAPVTVFRVAQNTAASIALQSITSIPQKQTAPDGDFLTLLDLAEKRDNARATVLARLC